MSKESQQIVRELEQIEDLIHHVNPSEAQRRVEALLFSMGANEVQVWEQDLRRTIKRFHKKRQRALLSDLDRKLCATQELKGGAESRHKSRELPQASDSPSSASPAEMLREDIRTGLKDLLDHHIFQWSTFYRESLFEFHRLAIEAIEGGVGKNDVLDVIDANFSSHAEALFNQGFQYKTVSEGASEQYARSKALAGLQRFLEIPVEIFTTATSRADDSQAVALDRPISSAMVIGILRGFMNISFSDVEGADLLATHPLYWLHYVVFLTPDDLDELLNILPEGDLRDTLDEVVVPFLKSVERSLLSGRTELTNPCVPVLSQFSLDLGRLDLSLRPPRTSAADRLIELQCYLSSSRLTRLALQEAVTRSVSLVIAPFRADLEEWLASSDSLSQVVHFVRADGSSSAATEDGLKGRLDLAFYHHGSPRVAEAPLTHNFAREFPLERPFLTTTYYHVYRPSVRDLLRTFEHRNGVRCWCSVRRSGKTTACFDLASASGASIIVSQTCDSTFQRPGSNLFYHWVTEAVDSERRISPDFFKKAVAELSEAGPLDVDRHVFVLDEYETLFGDLASAEEESRRIRYKVVQPLLNQMAAFGAENLLVFIGQDPRAHFILMGQNQLSAYIQQDAFPLFSYDSNPLRGEFVELVHKVLTDRVSLDAGFVSALYEETSGHPYLTVKLLILLVDWLIEKGCRIGELSLSEETFRDFAEVFLCASGVRRSKEFDFFRSAARDATTEKGLREDPWLWAVYTVIRSIARNSPSSLTLSMADFEGIFAELDLWQLNLSPGELLSTGRQANFLEFDDTKVRPRIKLLGRICDIG